MILMVRVKAWRLGRTTRSIVVVIPMQLADVLRIRDGDILDCKIDFNRRALIYRKIRSFQKDRRMKRWENLSERCFGKVQKDNRHT